LQQQGIDFLKLARFYRAFYELLAYPIKDSAANPSLTVTNHTQNTAKKNAFKIKYS
jgi:hypothetical protein